MSDELWKSINDAAKRAGKETAEWIRATLELASKEKQCFACGSPATHLYEYAVSPESNYSGSFEDIIAELKEGGNPITEDFTPITAHIAHCDEHYLDVGLYVSDRTGPSGPSYGRILIDHQCPFEGNISYSAPAGYKERPAYQRLVKALGPPDL